MSGDDVRTVVSLLAIIISLASLYYARKFFLQSNRPIVTAYIDEYADEQAVGGFGAFNLVVINTGNRPAVHVRISADRRQINLLLHPDAPSDRVDDVLRCFSEESEIPLLHSGEKLVSAFGSYSSAVAASSSLAYGSQIEVTMRYRDLDRRLYTSIQPLKIFARNGFAGSVWTKSAL